LAFTLQPFCAARLTAPNTIASSFSVLDIRNRGISALYCANFLYYPWPYAEHKVVEVISSILHLNTLLLPIHIFVDILLTMQADVISILYPSLPEVSALRLVLLEPGRFDDPIVQCRLLQPSDIQPNPRYEALSYVWGDRLHTTNIRLNEFEVPATVNLVSALRHLRRSDTTRTLWIDALCINQNCVAEKNHQVRRMTDIYRHAQRTLVWLGEWFDSEFSELTPDSIQNFLQRALELSRTDEMSYDNIILNHDGLACYMWTTELLESPWFRRIWVLQEAAVAQEVTFVCGRTTFPWDVLMEGISAIGNMTNQPYYTSVMKRWYEIRLKAVAFCRRYVQDEEYRQHFSRAPLPDRILSLLLLSNGQLATDRRDHLYALLGLAGQAEEMQHETSLTVDYERAPEEVLKMVAVYLLKATQDLRILYGAAYQTSIVVPSWVPTWQGNRLWNLARYFDPRNPLIRLPDDTPAKIFFSCDENSIMIKGHLVGHITKVGLPMREAGDRLSAKAFFEDWEQEILRPLEEDLPKACVRALVGDVVDQVTDADYGFTAMGVWCETLFHAKGWDEEDDRETNGSNIETLLYSALMGHRQVDETNLEALNGDLTMLCSQETSRLRGGAPFATSSGLIGFFDTAVLLEHYQNANICLFEGCNVPFILKGGPEEYELLGPCFLQPFITLKTTFGYPDWIALI